MFDALSDRLRAALAGLTGHGRITEDDVDVAMREVRLALLEADVNYKVVKDFVGRVKERAIGQDVIENINAGQMVVKIVHEELTAILGAGDRTFRLNGSPAVIAMVGLQGSGKTTSSAKLARWIVRQGRQPLLVAADPYRPAAVDQLMTLGAGLGIPVYSAPPGTPVVDIARGAVAQARQTGRDVVILDTAGRLQVDDALMAEIRALADGGPRPPRRCSSWTPWSARRPWPWPRRSATPRRSRGLVLTKIDGDARGGAALSISAVTGVAVKFMGTGEKTDALEVFHPDRLAGRILGMGDVVSLVERAQETYDAKQAEQHGREAAQEQLHAGRLPGADAAGQEDGPAGLAHGDDPGFRRRRQAGAGGHRPRRAGARRGHHPLHDARGARRPRHPQRLPPAAHRARLRDQPAGGQPPRQAVRRDAAGHEADAWSGGPPARTAHGTTVAVGRAAPQVRQWRQSHVVLPDHDPRR